MGMEIIIDNIALWRGKINDAFTVRTSAIGTRYQDKNGAHQVAVKPIYRYAKTYTVKDGKSDLRVSLFVRTFDTDAKKVEKKLDEVAKTIKPAQARKIIANPVYMAFEYLNITLED
jgi:hypothetical protein